MAYTRWGRGSRGRGGYSNGRILDIKDTRYARLDGNRFSCLGGNTQDGADDDVANFSESDTDGMASDKSESLLADARTKKKRKLNSSSGGGAKLVSDDEIPIDYDSLPDGEKINLILSKVSINEARLLKYEKYFDKLELQNKHVKEIGSVVVSHADRIRLLEYKSIDLEARSRRNNLLFYGHPESRNEDCKETIRNHIRELFEIDITDSAICRAHRIGRFDRNRKRPIIVAFQEYALTETIARKGNVLKDTNFSLSRDYPIEITRARKTMWPAYKKLKEENPLSKVAIVYPAKLIMNGEVQMDLFPEWDTVLRGSRIDLDHPSQQSFTRTLNERNTVPKTTDAFSMSTPVGRTGTNYRCNQSVVIPTPMEVASNSGPGGAVNLGDGSAAAGTAADGSFLGDATSARGDQFKTPKSVPPQAQRPTSQRRPRSGTRTTSRSRSRSKSTTRMKTPTKPPDHETQSPTQTGDTPV